MNQKTYNIIKRWIRIYVCNETYEDLTHDTILKLYDAGIKDEVDIKKLCTIVAKNILIDQKRKEKRFEVIYDANILNIPEKADFQRDYIEPIKYKEFYILKYKLGLSLKEISDYYNQKESTIRVRHMKMKHEFRELNNL